ncbi:MAG: peptidylprolyl isomerase [Nitrospirae bacterium]|nr:peptidylprolyl isomerase [Nitrospirota bacterium]
MMKKLIFLTLIPCLLFTIHCSLSYGAILLDRVVAVVNDDVITWSELRYTIEQEVRESMAGLAEKDKKKALKGLEKTFLNRLIDVKLQLQDAKKKGLDVKASEVENAISNIKKKYNLADEDLLTHLKTEGFTLEEYKAKLKEQILLSKFVNYEVGSNVIVTDKEITDFYNINKEKYEKGESVRVRQIFFNAPKDDMKRAQLELRAQEIISKLKVGEDFTRLVEEFSEDTSKKYGGDLGYIWKGSALKEIEDVAFSLKEGEVSKPFWSTRGLHIIKVEHKLDLSTSEKIRDEIKEILFERALALKYEAWIKDLRSRAYIEINLNEK